MMLFTEVPSAWEIILDGLKWLIKVAKPILPIVGIIAVLMFSWFATRLIHFVKDLLTNLANPTGFFFFLIGFIALVVFLVKFGLL